MELHTRTEAVVHLDRLVSNLRNIRARMKPGVEVMGVLKGDGYGHGIAGVYPTLKAHGIKCYAAAVWEEGRALREAGAEDEPILLLGDTWDDQLPELIRWRLTPSIFAVETAAKLDALAGRAGVVQPIHIKLDTGMNRIGFPADERCYEPIEAIAAMKNLRITGAFTHFARADELDCDMTERQFKRFTDTVAALRARGVDIPFIHVANSPSILLRPEVQLDAVRAGDVLFGLCPVDLESWEASGIQEVMTWRTYVALVKTIPVGAQVGYGGAFTAERETRLATIPVGFADGYRRGLSNRGWVTIRGRRAPVVGRVCMDQFMADVTDIPGVERGDEVLLLGGEMTIQRMAELLDANVDEIPCGVSRRVPKVYVTGE